MTRSRLISQILNLDGVSRRREGRESYLLNAIFDYFMIERLYYTGSVLENIADEIHICGPK